MTARNFGPVMAMAARVTVAAVHEVVDLGALDPEAVVTPGIFVQRVVCGPRAAPPVAGPPAAAAHRAAGAADDGAPQGPAR